MIKFNTLNFRNIYTFITRIKPKNIFFFFLTKRFINEWIKKCIKYFLIFFISNKSSKRKIKLSTNFKVFIISNTNFIKSNLVIITKGFNFKIIKNFIRKINNIIMWFFSYNNFTFIIIFKLKIICITLNRI